MKIREAYSNIAKSSIKPILVRLSEHLVFLPSFLIFIQTVTLVIILNSVPDYPRLAIWGNPDLLIEHHRLKIQNFIIQIYLPIVVISIILISIGLFLNMYKRFIKLGQSRQISDNEISKRKIIIKQRGVKYLIQNDLTTVPYKPRFRLIHFPIIVFIIFTGILASISNESGFNSNKTFNFIIQNYIPVVILCWIAFSVLFLITNLRKKLSNVNIKRLKKRNYYMKISLINLGKVNPI
ncbi:MAG: hypothetical protein KGD58_06485 [Candidatus Lokiarchaeota archaeon]|nr:hypothetical protein [Candidatus Lokiarchaeota archaeon]